jgi:hypothetical protein
MSEPVAKPRTMIDLDEFERRLSRPSATSRADGDPLAELARLVGGQPDRLDTVFEEFSAPRPAADQLPPPRYQDQWSFPQQAPTPPPFPRTQPLSGDFAAIEAGLRGSIPPEIPDFSGARRPPAVPSPQPVAFEEAGQEAAWDDHSHHAPEYADAAQRVGPRSRRPLYITAAVILVGLGGIGASFALKVAPGGPRELAMIRAADGPTKVLADNSGKADQAENASLLDKGPQPTPVALVNRSEQPVDLSRTDLPQADRPARVMTIGSAQLAPGAANVPVPPPPGQMYPPGVTMPTNVGDLIEPRKVKTVSVKPDGTLLTTDNSAQAGKPPASPPAAKVSTPKAVATHVVTPPRTQVASNDTDKAAAQDRDQTDAVQEPATARGKPAPARPQPQKIAAAEPDATDTAANGKGAFAVQLAAPGSEEEARQSMNRLGKQFSGALNGHHLGYHRASVGDKSVYRVRVGGLSHDEATALCEKLKTSGGTCFVAKN